MWVDLKAKDRSYSIETYFDNVTIASTLGEEFLVLELSRTGKPDSVLKKMPSSQQLCFSLKDELSKPLGLYLGSNKEKRYYCLENSPLEKFPQLNKLESLENSFIIPELNIAISDFDPNSSATAFCDCKKLKFTDSKVKSVYHFTKYLFYIELQNGKYLRFSKGRRNPILNIFKVEEVFKSRFESENRKPKSLSFRKLEPGGYLFVQLANRKVFVFHADNLKFGQDGRLNRILLRRNLEGTIEEKGNKLYYGLMPFTLAFDIVTLPIQLGVFVYNMGRANKNK